MLFSCEKKSTAVLNILFYRFISRKKKIRIPEGKGGGGIERGMEKKNTTKADFIKKNIFNLHVTKHLIYLHKSNVQPFFISLSDTYRWSLEKLKAKHGKPHSMLKPGAKAIVFLGCL